jgi:hypothetical protein
MTSKKTQMTDISQSPVWSNLFDSFMDVCLSPLFPSPTPPPHPVTHPVHRLDKQSLQLRVLFGI